MQENEAMRMAREVVRKVALIPVGGTSWIPGKVIDEVVEATGIPLGRDYIGRDKQADGAYMSNLLNRISIDDRRTVQAEIEQRLFAPDRLLHGLICETYPDLTAEQREHVFSIALLLDAQRTGKLA